MLTFGLKVAVVGFSIVFMTLVLLMAIITLQSKFFIALGKKKEQGEVALAKIDPMTSTLLPSDEIEIEEEMDEEEIIAVISAAIAAFGGQSIRIKNIRRVDQSKNWVDTGRSALMAKRQF